MKVTELNKDMLQNRAFYIEEDDGYWVEKAENFFISLVPEEYRAFNLKIIDKLSNVGELIDATSTFSMFDGPIVVIIRDAGIKQSKKGADDGGEIKTDNSLVKELCKSAEGLAESNSYLIVRGAPQPSKSSLYKSFIPISTAKLDVFELQKYIKQMFVGGIESKAIDVLADYTSRDMSRISCEAQKLNAYKNNGMVTVDDVKELVENTVENEIFELSNAFASKNNDQANTILERFYRRNVSCSYMLATLVNQYRRMMYASLSMLGEAELAEKLGVKPYSVKVAREAGKKYTKARLKSCFDILSEAEFKFKSGTLTEENAFRTAVSKLLMS